MKTLLAIALLLTMSACGTIGTIMQGAGNGLQNGSRAEQANYNCTPVNDGIGSYTCR